MGVTVTLKLKNLETSLKNLEESDKHLKYSANILRGLIIKNWEKALGANDKGLKKLSNMYEEIKRYSGRNPVRDLNFTGKLYQSFQAIKIGLLNYALIAITDNEKGKLSDNYGYDPNILKLGKRLIDLTVEAFRKRIIPK